jgi:hypothetical protein
MSKPMRGIGPVPEGLSSGLTDFLTQVRRIALDVSSGRIVVAGSSGSSGAGSGPGGGTGGGTGPGGDYEPDLTPPPTPTGGNVVAGIDFVGMTTDAPTFTQGHGHLATVVYGKKWSAGPLPTFSDDSKVMEFPGEVSTFATEPATQWHIWLKWKTKDGVLSISPAGGANGFQVTTGQDVTKLLAALSAKITNGQLDPTSNFIYRANLFAIAPPTGTGGVSNIVPFAVQTVPTTTPAGELLPAGVYIDAAYVRNLEVAMGRFQNAFITNAMIVSVSASRITSGVISVGNYIQSSNYVPGVSGWRINGDGTASFRGLQIAGASTFDGQVTVRNADGSILLQSGGGLAWGNVTGRPADDAIKNNLIDLSWWKRFGAIPWPQNGEENTIYATADVGGAGPKGGSDIVWYAREATGDSGASGGWDAYETLALDQNKTYRFVVPIRVRDTAGGSAYWGVQQNTVCGLNSTSLDGNPYFAALSRNFLQQDRWYLFVGFVFPYGSTNNTHEGSGIFDCKTGQLVSGGSNYNHAAGGARGHRAYQYYAGPNATQLFGRPMVNVVDGTEPSLREYFESAAVLNSVLSFGQNLIPNSDQTSAMTMSGSAPFNGATFDTGLQWASNIWPANYTLQGMSTRNVTMHQSNALGTGNDVPAADVYPLGPWDFAHSVPVVGGQRYCFSAYIQAHRCHGGVGLQFFYATGAFHSEIAPTPVATSQVNADSLALYTRAFVLGVAPADAAYARPYVRKYSTFDGQVESWFWIAAPQLEVVNSGATGPSHYQPGPAGSTRQLGYSGELNATYGATLGTNVYGSINDSNVYSLIVPGAIKAGHIGVANLSAINATIGVLQTATSGQRVRIADNIIQVFGPGGAERIRIAS